MATQQTVNLNNPQQNTHVPSTSSVSDTASSSHSTEEPGAGGGGYAEHEQFKEDDDDDPHQIGESEVMLHGKVTMENFALIRVLGKGAYGKVYLVRKVGGHDSGRYYAMKVLKKTRVSQKQKTLEHTLAERKVLERLKGGPFLVDMAYAFQSETKLHIVMEFVRGGELFTHLCRRKKFDVPTTRALLAEIVVALEHVHGAGVIYRDLKLENILLDEEGHVKLTDFGLAKAFVQRGMEPNSTNSYCGTIEYMPPEIVRRQPEGYGQCADWWSFGVIAFELLTGCSPFTVDGDQNSTADIARRILTKKVPFPKWLESNSRHFIGQLLNKDPTLRLGSRGASEVKRHRFFDGINWDAVEQRQVPGAVKPSMAGGVTDVENFAAEFTAQTPLFSPADKAPPECHSFFRGYSFVSPSVLFSADNVIGQESLEASVRLLSAECSPFFAHYRLDISPEGLLGKGSFSICRKCHRIADGRQFAVKIVSQRFAHQARREVRVLEALQPHPHIVSLVEAMSDQFHHYIVLEMLQGGELLQRLRRMEKFTEVQAAHIMAQLVAAVKHMHDRDIVHRDLKPENILFERELPGTVVQPKLRLVDFGFARILPRISTASSAKSLITPLCGTLHYAAPEVLDIEDELPQYNQQCDLWSLGVILFTMLSGKVPFHAKSQAETAAEVIARIRSADFSFADPVWAMVSQSAKDLITGLLTVDPTRRLSLFQLEAHPWLKTGRKPSESGAELPTPTILPSSADETFNATISAFLHANRDGFQLMDVQTAPLLVKRRGLKRQRSQEKNSNIGGTNGDVELGKQSQDSGKLSTVPEGAELAEHPKRRPTTLDVLGAELEGTNQTPSSAAFTEYRDTKPPYLKYSRDDVARGDGGAASSKHQFTNSTSSSSADGMNTVSDSSAVRSSNDSNESQ